MRSKLLALLISLSMTLAMMNHPIEAEATSDEGQTFVDMPDDWSTEALQRAVNNGLINGYNNRIMPKDSLTRAQMATIINRAFGAHSMASLDVYSDLPLTAWYRDEMAKAVFMGTFKGSDGQLNPDQNITRQEVFVALARVYKLSGADQSILTSYSDVNDISQWAKDGVASMVTAGYVSGSDGRINPKATITRAEFAKVMDNLTKTYINESGSYSANLFGNVVVNKPDVMLQDMTINGDLIVADGVADSTVTLNNVIVSGRTIVRGGGTDSIVIKGNSSLGNVIIGRVDGEVRVFVEEGSNVGRVIADGKDDVILVGQFSRVTLSATGIKIVTRNAYVQNLVVEGDNAGIEAEINTTLVHVTVSGRNANVRALTGSQINEITVYGEGAKVSGTGSVGLVKAKVSNVEVNTSNTLVIADTLAEGVYLGSVLVPAGTASGDGVFIPLTPIPADVPTTSGSGQAVEYLATDIAVTSASSSITSHKGTLQMGVDLSPSYVTNSDVTWEVRNSTGAASINADGVLTALANGAVTVLATTTDGTELTAEKAMVISGQLSNINTLNNLEINGATVPGFSSVESSYTFTLPYGTAAAPSVVGIPADSKASVSVKNAKNINSISAEDRTTSVTVFAEDGEATKTYTILFNLKAPATATSLNKLMVDVNDDGVADPLSDFSSDKDTYAVTLVKRTVNTPVVVAEASDLNASVKIVNAVDVTSEDIVQRTTLVEVTAEDGITAKTYSITFDVTPLNTSANLSAIQVDDMPLEGFSSNVSSYPYNLPKFTTVTPSVTANPVDPLASHVIYKAVDITSDDIEDRTTTIVVTAENGVAQTYSVIFNVTMLEDDATLQSLMVDDSLVADFDAETLTYIYPPLEKFTTVTPRVEATATYSGASVTADGLAADVRIVPASDVTSLVESHRTTVVTVTAEDGVTVQTYTVVFRVIQPSSVNTLTNIFVDGYGAVDDFSPETTTYDESLRHETIDTPSVTVTKSDGNSSVVITDATDVNSLIDSQRTTTIVVTAEDGSENTYLVKFSVDLDDDATLSSMEVDVREGEGPPIVFSSSKLAYDYELKADATTPPAVDFVLSDPNASAFKTNAEDVRSSDPVKRTTTVRVTAEDGTTWKAYTIEFILKD